MSVTNDLTTDAIPSPPRDNEATTSNTTKDNVNEDYDNGVPFKEHFNPKGETHRKSQKLPNFSGYYPVNINVVNSEKVQIGSNVTIYNNKSKEKKSKKENNYDINEAIKTLFSLKTPVKENDIKFLSGHMIHEEWKNTARKLGYSEGQISQFHGDHFHYGIKEVIYQFLIDWIQNEAEHATVQKLSKTLWETNHQDAVIRWSKEYVK